MDLHLNDAVALVVGGSGLLGTAIVDRLRGEGATVVTASRSSGDVRLDAADQASVEAGIAEVLRQHGRLDVLVVSAAPAAQTIDPDSLTDPDAVLAAIGAKAMTFLRVANAVLPHMTAAGSGRIVGIGGQNAYITGNLLGAERNAALVIAAKSLADANAGSGVTVNVVDPGGVTETPSSDVAVGSGGQATPGQVAALVAFLVSGLAPTISGEAISVGHHVRGIALT